MNIKAEGRSSHMGYNETNPVTEAFEAHVQHFWLFDAGIYFISFLRILP
jgi:hypothetical protein